MSTLVKSLSPKTELVQNSLVDFFHATKGGRTTSMITTCMILEKMISGTAGTQLCNILPSVGDSKRLAESILILNYNRRD